MSLMENLFGQQDNTRVVRNQPNQLFWNNGKIDRIVTPINNNQSLVDNRDWSTKKLNDFFESRIGRLYSDVADAPVNFVLPTREGVTNLVSNQSSGFDKAMGALETLPVVAGAGYKGVKALNKVVNSKFLDQANSLLKSLPNRQTMDYNNNIEALAALQKFSDEKGYGLKNVIHYAKDQNKTDAAIKEIMNRNRTFSRGVEAASKSDAIKYLTEVPGNTGATRHGLPEGKTGIYTTNSRITSEPYTKGRGYVGDVRIPSNFNSNNRLQWVESNKELPSNVVKRIWDSNKYPANIESMLSPADIALDDIKKFGELADKADVNSKEYSVFKNKENEARQLFESIKSKYRTVFKETNPNNNTYNHYIIQGEPGQKLLDVINIKEVNPSNWNQRIRTHHGEYSSGLSLASMLGLSTANQDSIRNLFGGNR